MEIIIYSTTTCAFCHVLTAWLDKQNIPYTKKNTDEDESALAEFMSVNDGNLGVPFTVIKDGSGNETKILGFDQPKFKQALGI
ncbi:glutaredoxin family protein [Candidatus Saccharibacteria bacterium]|nr:glutaredoxin family protein [Candidatus Saccharibacteria bacterium]